MAYDALSEQGHRDYWTTVAKAGQSVIRARADHAAFDPTALQDFTFLDKDRAIYDLVDWLHGAAPQGADAPLHAAVLSLVDAYRAQTSELTRQSPSGIVPGDAVNAARASAADRAILNIHAAAGKAPLGTADWLVSFLKRSFPSVKKNEQPVQKSWRMGINLR